jgi:hypothetical protein
MNTLDKKLKAIAHRIMQLDPKGDYGYSLPEYIEQITQAFKEAGWTSPIDIYELAKSTSTTDHRSKAHEAMDKYLEAGGPDDFVIMSRNDWQRNAALAGLMSNQEWYSRFKKELSKTGMIDTTGGDNVEVAERVASVYLAAARKASGLEQ